MTCQSPRLTGASAAMQRAACYDDNSSRNAMVRQCPGIPDSVTDWGFPGHLTEKEYAVFKKFRDEVARRGDEFKRAVFCFGSEEEERYALCRWLRARKYDLPATIKMLECAVQMRRSPSKYDFYPDARKALHVEPSIFISQYPQIYCGQCKEGYPLFISKPGVLNVAGLECITTVKGILNYHWHAMVHDFGARLQAAKKENPNFQRFEVVCIIDLENLAVSNVGKRPLNIIKFQTEIDSICFPESLHKFVIINAPSAFPMLWNIMKSWITPRTRAKVEIFSQRSQWEPRILELVNVNELPSDYGGKGSPTDVLLEQQNKEEGVLRQYVYTLVVCKSAKTGVIEVEKGQEAEIFIMTRSLREGVFSFCFQAGDQYNKALISSPWVIKHNGKGLEEENPTRNTLSHSVKGPCTFYLKANCDTGSWSSENFLVAAKVRRIDHENRENIQSPQNGSRPKHGSQVLSTRSNQNFDNDFIVSSVIPESFPVQLKSIDQKPLKDELSTESSQSSYHILEDNPMSPRNDSLLFGCLGWSCGLLWK